MWYINRCEEDVGFFLEFEDYRGTVFRGFKDLENMRTEILANNYRCTVLGKLRVAIDY